MAKKQETREEREARYSEKLKQYLDYDNVFSFPHLYQSARLCCRGVGWKASTQGYRNNLMEHVQHTYEVLQKREYHSEGFYEFDICERGKPRHIKSVHISERTVQRCLCDYSLVPLISRSFIYDNGACLEGKGVDFTVERLKKHLHRYFLKHGNEGYVLKFDFSKYFDNINHEKLKELLHKIYEKSPELEQILFELIDNFGEKGLGLGSQISQICALAYPNRIDHYMTEVMGIKYYGRYMDDGYMISESKEKLQKCLVKLKEFCEEYGIILNPKKTQIIKLSKGLPFLKRRFVLTQTGKVIQIPNKKNATKMRHKLKAFKKKLDAGEIKRENIETSYISWKGHAKKLNNYFEAHRVDTVYERYYGESSDEN